MYFDDTDPPLGSVEPVVYPNGDPDEIAWQRCHPLAGYLDDRSSGCRQYRTHDVDCLAHGSSSVVKRRRWEMQLVGTRNLAGNDAHMGVTHPYDAPSRQSESGEHCDVGTGVRGGPLPENKAHVGSLSPSPTLCNVRRRSAGVREEAEGMTLGIHQHSHLVLWLVGGERCATGNCPGNCFIEIVDPEVEVHHHQLLARHRGPGWCHVVGFPLHLELPCAIGRPKQSPPLLGR